MASVHPIEASVLHPSQAFQALNDRLIDLIAHYRVVQQSLESGSDAAVVLQGTTDRLDQFQCDLEHFVEDQTPGVALG
jgi:hypothetical protein